MSIEESGNKRILKNTIFLYMRMFLLMAIGIYTSRVVLRMLGFVDYGLYNVVGGFVSMFAIFTSSLSNAIGRYITISLGEDNKERTRIVFCTSLNILFLLSIIVLLLFEIVGLWFINYKMVVPADRLYAVNWVCQCTIISFIFSLISVPYNSLIIAHERMSAFAYISLIESVLKLGSAILLSFLLVDKLIAWAIIQVFCSLLIRNIYGIYCRKHFTESRYSWVFDKSLFKNMGVFAGWNFIGEFAGILRNQGINVLLNLYYGPIINSANAIAMQVNGVIGQFSGNFLTAANPQIYKYYGSNELRKSYILVQQVARLSFLLMLILVVPILCETDFILEMWLGKVPNYSSDFVRLILILALIEVLSFPVISIQRATGKMRNYQIVTGTIHLMNFPLSWLFLHLGMLGVTVYKIAIIIAIVNTFARLFMLKQIVPISIAEFFKNVIARLVILSCLLYPVFHILKFGHISNLLLSIAFVLILVFFVGLKTKERKAVLHFIRAKL